MLRMLLADRFHPVFHREPAGAGYALVVAKGGLKIKPNETPANLTTHRRRNSFTAQNMSMAALAADVSHALLEPGIGRYRSSGAVRNHAPMSAGRASL